MPRQQYPETKQEKEKTYQVSHGSHLPNNEIVMRNRVITLVGLNEPAVYHDLAPWGLYQIVSLFGEGEASPTSFLCK